MVTTATDNVSNLLLYIVWSFCQQLKWKHDILLSCMAHTHSFSTECLFLVTASSLKQGEECLQKLCYINSGLHGRSSVGWTWKQFSVLLSIHNDIRLFWEERIQISNLVHDLRTVAQDGMQFVEGIQTVFQSSKPLVSQTWMKQNTCFLKVLSQMEIVSLIAKNLAC